MTQAPESYPHDAPSDPRWISPLIADAHKNLRYQGGASHHEALRLLHYRADSHIMQGRIETGLRPFHRLNARTRALSNAPAG